MNIIAKDIISLLRIKHDGALFVAECKDGPTQSTSHCRMDAWVMDKSWANPLMTAYEIKMSRSDFANDKKWHLYLDYCNEFYFVSPSDVIRPEEIPAEAGLMWVAKTGTRLFKKKIAPRREILFPEYVVRYILMARTRITSDYYSRDQSEYWERWLLDKKESKTIGHEVAGKIGEICRALQDENRELKSRMESYNSVRNRIIELGLDPDRTLYGITIQSAFDKLNGAVPGGLINAVRRSSLAIKSIEDAIAEIAT